MNPVLFISFLIPASVAFLLIVLLIKERDHLTPRNHNDSHKPGRDLKSRSGEKDGNAPDYFDLSGGTMGI